MKDELSLAMLLRSPWLSPRLRWFALACFDALAVVASYSINYWHAYQTWPAVRGSAAGVTALWLSISYLCGRYSHDKESKGVQIVDILLKAGIVSAVILGLVAVANWSSNVKDLRTFRSFAIPTVTGVAALSSLAQSAMIGKEKSKEKWLFIANEYERRSVMSEVSDSGGSLAKRCLFTSARRASLTIREVGSHNISSIVIGEEEVNEEVLQELLGMRSKGAQIENITTWAERTLQRVPPEIFNSQWLIRAEGFHLNPETWSWRIKRYGDLVGSVTLLTLSFPVMALVAVLIKIEDGGPILFRQCRTGIYGQPFILTKFRSMKTDAEKNGAEWSIKGDRRVTRIGGIIRRLRVDELPQLINVISGEMSLIGPRPERPEIEKKLERSIPHYRVRHWIRPGLSGWAQVSIPYGASIEATRKKLSYDIYYIRNYSVALDFLILLKTMRLVGLGQGSVPKE